MTTVYGGSVYPTSYDSFTPNLVDTVDEVIADHPNTALEAIEYIEAKLGIDNDPVVGLGGVSFDVLGQAANPGGAGEPTIWADNSGGPGFGLKYTDDLAVTYSILLSGSVSLDIAYDYGGSGLGRSITADSGPVEITVPDTTNDVGLKVVNNDDTNDPTALEIENNTSDGNSIEFTGTGIGRVLGSNRHVAFGIDNSSGSNYTAFLSSEGSSTGDVGTTVSSSASGSGDALVSLAATTSGAGGAALSLSADKLIDIDAGTALSINSSGGVINIGNDAVAQNMNIGTGAAARTIIIGNATGASAIGLQSGTGGIIIHDGVGRMDFDGSGNLSTTGIGTIDIDCSGNIKINSTGGYIAIGNDAVAQNIHIGIGAAVRTITIGNATGATAVDLKSGTGGINLHDGIAQLDMDGAGALTETALVSADITPSGALTFRGGGVSQFGDDTGYFAFGGTGALSTSGITTLDLDCSGNFQINSSGGVISIGNDAVAQNINIGTGAAVRTIQIHRSDA